VHLAQRIASQTSVIDEHLRNNDLPQPGFQPGAPVEPIQREVPDIKRARTEVIEATIELKQLLEGPVALLLPEVSSGSISAWCASRTRT
jgi:hypothetical protein